jgi:uncharacterized surface protein with fasciclin (FAS1) repeats
MKKYTIGWLGVLALLIGMTAYAQDNSSYGSAPQQTASTSTGRDIVSVCSADTMMTMFARHLSKSGLTSTLQGSGPFTVFAPDNAAFNARSKRDLDAEHKDPAVLASTMKYHILTGKSLTAADLSKMDGQMLTMDNGMQLHVRVQGDKIMVGNAHILRSDQTASNGVIHVIDHVEIPGKASMAMKSHMHKSMSK